MSAKTTPQVPLTATHRRKDLTLMPGVAGVMPALCGADVRLRTDTTTNPDRVTCKRCLDKMGATR